MRGLSLNGKLNGFRMRAMVSIKCAYLHDSPVYGTVYFALNDCHFGRRIY